MTEVTQAEIDGVAAVFEELASDPIASQSAIIVAKKLKRVFGKEENWRPMSAAPKDRTPILLRLKDDIPHRGERPDLDVWDGITFVGRHPGIAEDGFDLGWNFAAPVGHGGFPDDWFVGWKPLPATEQQREG